MPLALAILMAVFLSGCIVTAEDLNRQTSHIASNSRDIKALSEEINDLRDKTKLQSVEFERRLDQARQNLPEIRLELDRMHSDLQRLTHIVELSQRRGSLEANEEKTISLELRYIKLRLDRLEASLSLPPLKPPSGLEPEDGPSATDEEKPEEGPQTTLPEEQYETAKTLYDKGLYKAAQTSLDEFIKKFPESEQAPAAQYYIGECYYQQREYEDAIFEYQKVIKKYGQSRWISNALLKQALSFQAIGDKTTAKLLLQKLAREYPQTYSGREAKKRLDNMR